MTPLEHLRQAHAAGVASALDLCVLHGGDVVLAERLGDHASWDLASLTKALVGAPLACDFVDRGLLSFGLPVTDEGGTLAQILSHSAGYPAWLPLYERAGTRDEVLRLARETPLEAVPGERHTYSDIGFLVLCGLLEGRGGARIDRLAAEHLELAGLTWGAAGAAPTEDCPVRGCVVTDEVHDLNCRAMEGVSTHAGLFGDARSVARAVQQQVERSRDTTSALAWAWSHRGAGSHWLGWDGRSAGASSSGQHFPADTVGHLGFTGTSVWAAPSKDVVVVFLTNRVHPSIEDIRIRQLRPAVHDAVVEHLRSRGLWAG
ncbi:MAG: beta-lactamase family protein [Proteobacteria bacterium]|nr:beta-lactamase family protein [Pseudomonadota bacterium]MCP4915325.1 beta-lactamase family protein [Pseudomonadota bacterium]